MKSFGHHLAQPVLDTVLAITRDDPRRLLSPRDIGRAMLAESGSNPGHDKIDAAAIELAHRGLLYRRRECTASRIGRPRQPGWPLR